MLLISLIRLVTNSEKPVVIPWNAPVVTKPASSEPPSPGEQLKIWGSKTAKAIPSVCSKSSFKVSVGPYPQDLEAERPSSRQIFRYGTGVLPAVTPLALRDCLVCEPLDPLMCGTMAIEMPSVALHIPDEPKRPIINGRLADTAETEKIIRELEAETARIEPDWDALTGYAGKWYRERYAKNYEFFFGEVKARTTRIKDYKRLLELQRRYNELFIESESETNRSFEEATKAYAELSELYRKRFVTEKEKALDFIVVMKSNAEKIRKHYETAKHDAVEAYFDMFLTRLPLPTFIPKNWEIHYDEMSQILLVDFKFLALDQLNFCKPVKLKVGETLKPLNKGETKLISAAFYPSIALRLAKEIINHDFANLVQAVCINGWVKHRDGATGHERKAYICSLFSKKGDLASISLENADPVKCFESLKGRVIRTETLEIAPVNPVLQFDKNDKRFVEGRDVLDAMREGQNLASIEWEEFEHLVRELFSKLFSKPGVEVRVTQASRDKGVDAVVFDPTPITGGKIVIQAKRYVNTVDVSAVRDLYGTLMNEGAGKGILVTTSNYGADSYDFAKNKPINLINGAELLGLLEAHGYKARIDLEEARRMAIDQPLRR